VQRSVFCRDICCQDFLQVRCTAHLVVIHENQDIREFQVRIHSIELLHSPVNLSGESVENGVIAWTANNGSRRSLVQLLVQPLITRYGFDLTEECQLLSFEDSEIWGP